MVTRDLLAELSRRGVRLEAEGGRLVARGPSNALTPELAAQIKDQRDALLWELQQAPGSSGSGKPLTTLPEPLVRLVTAAASGQLDRIAFLAPGKMIRLGEYVVASAALYAAGIEPDKQLRGLWSARAAWNN